MATVFARFVDTEPEEFKRATEVTYLGTVYGTMAALKRMTARDRGHDRPGRLGAVLPRDPAAGGLLRREVRRSAGSPTRSAPSCATTTATCRSRWSSCPGVNTTQFNWCRSKLPDASPCRCPRSTSPRSPPRRSTGPRTTAAASCGSATAPWRRSSARKLAPGLADRYLASTGFSGQQVRDMPVSADRPDNLFEPVPERGRHPRHLRRAGQDATARSCGRPPTAGRSPALAPLRAPPSARRRGQAAPDERSRRSEDDRWRAQRAARPARVRAAGRRRARRARRPARRLRLDVLSALGLRRVLLHADRRLRAPTRSPRGIASCGAATTSPAA